MDKLAQVLLRLAGQPGVFARYQFESLIDTYSQGCGLGDLDIGTRRRMGRALRALVGVKRSSEWTQQKTEEFKKLPIQKIEAALESALTKPSTKSSLPAIEDLVE